MGHDGGDVFSALAQRRQPQVQHCDPIEQIRAEATVGHPSGQGRLGGDHQTQIQGELVIGPHRSDRAILERSQQSSLHRSRDAVDLVEEQRAAARPSERSLAIGRGPGEGPAHVPEQLRFHQRLGQGPAVDRDEGAASALAGLVQRSSGELLAGARLPLEQHGHVGAGGQLEHRERLPQGEALADQLAEATRAAGGQLQRLGLGLDLEHAASHLERGAGRKSSPADPRALVVSAVGAALVLHHEAVALRPNAQVSARDPLVGQHQIAVGAGAHPVLVALAQGDRTALVVALDHHQLGAPPAAALERFAVHGRDGRVGRHRTRVAP